MEDRPEYNTDERENLFNRGRETDAQKACNENTAPFRGIDDTSFLIQEPHEAYHAKTGKEFLSSHMLGAFIRCPLEYHQRITGTWENKDSKAYALGRAAHTMILEGVPQYDKEYSYASPPINPETEKPYGATAAPYKAFVAEVEATGKTLLTQAQHCLILEMAKSVMQHKQAMTLLEKGVAEAVVECTYGGTLIHTRMDWLNPERGMVDLKTCDNLTNFEMDARRFNYINQLAFYRSALSLKAYQNVPVYMIAVEKRPPFRCGVWRVDPHALHQAHLQNHAAIGRLLTCERTDVWPTGYEEIRDFSGM